MKKAVIFIVSLILLMGLTACSSQDVDKTPSTGDTKQPTGESSQDTPSDNGSDVEEAVNDQMISEEDDVEIGEMI